MRLISDEPALRSPERASFHSQGYVHVRNLLNRNKIEQLRARVITTLLDQQWIDVIDGQPVPRLPVRRIGSPEFLRCLQALMTHEELHLIVYDPVLITLMEHLLEQPVFVHPRKMVRLTYPYALNPVDRIPPHQDLFYVKGERDTFTLWIPLGDYPPLHGGLQVLEASHREGLLPVRPNAEGRFNCSAADVQESDPRWRTPTYSMGDVLVMHALTVHSSGLNRSGVFRLSLDCRVSARRGVINEDELLPPYYPQLPSWDVLSESWTTRNVFEIPPELQVESASQSPTIALGRTSVINADAID